MSSSSTTLFIALQCSQCSTMQVKQKKKSSNKWSCAICNQKQSVRRVFAQGLMAKDLRKFVQDFNMSRKSFDDGDSPLAGTLDPPPEHHHGEVDRKQKRSDWSAYLDREEQQQDHIDDGDDFEPLVVTELQKGMFKKRRVAEDSTAGSDKLFKMPLSYNAQELHHRLKSIHIEIIT
ncbi:MRN complex-interacting protein isoform X2 [Cajanus cajan]|uniref:MRN complex-interacting protein isoform X2 n=1 Tax=Cajanus cajan TaxID=3821 RepID=UPI00098D7F43|nr:MRN complex-interacting protein isoform X2 [Cajanus cajan]